MVPLESESLLSPVNDDKDFVNFDDLEDDVTNQVAEKADMMMLNCDEILNPFKMSKFEVFKDCSFMKTTGNVTHIKDNKGLKLRNSSDQQEGENTEKYDLELSQNSIFNPSQDPLYSLSSSLELISKKDIKIRAYSAHIHYYDSYFTLFNEARERMKSINFSSIETMKYSSSDSSGVLDIFARKKFFYSEDHWKERKQIKDSRVSKSLPEKLPNNNNSRMLFFSEEDLPKRQKKESHLIDEGNQELCGTEGINVSFQLGRSHLNLKEEEEEIPILLTIKDNNGSSFDINYTKDVCIILGVQSIDVEQLEHAFIEIGKNLDRNDRLSVMMMDDEEFLIKMCQADCEILQFVRNLITLKKPQKRKEKNLNIFSCLAKTIELLSERRYQSNFTSIIILTDTRIYQNNISNQMGHRVIDKFLMFMEKRNLLNDSRFSIYAIGCGDNNFNILGEICYDCRGEFYHIKNSSELIGALQLVCSQAFSKKYFDISLIIEKANSNANIQITIPNTFVKEIPKGRMFQVNIPNLIQGEEKHISILAKVDVDGFPSSDTNHLLSLFTGNNRFLN